MPRHPEQLRLDRLPTPVGIALLVTDEQGVLRALDFADYEPRMRRLLRLHYGITSLVQGAAPVQLTQTLQRYFEGELHALSAVQWETGGTPFQRAVWKALLGIAPGETRSYGDLAKSLGRPGAARAVGWANGSNPVAIVVPCHRVVGANGKLTGYAGGLHRKQWLLSHEAPAAAAAALRCR